MQTQITARHFTASTTLQEYVTERLSKLEKYYDGITHAHVILTNDAVEKGAEITINVYRQRLTAQNTGTTHEEAIDRVVERLRKQLIRYKAKLRSKDKYVHH